MALRGVFIGFGNVAANGHLPGWDAHPDVDIVAATDGVEERRVAFLDAVPTGRVYADPAEMLTQEQLDFVDICTPPGSHADLIRMAHANGLHVLCEKPTVTHADDLVSLAANAGRKGLVLHTVHNWLEAPLCRKISTLIDDGALGTVREVTWETLRTKPAMAVPGDGAVNWRLDPAIAGGGILVDHGWHALYCVARWAGGKAGTVSARLETRKFTDWPLDDTASVDLTFSGATASIFLTWTADTRENRISIVGSAGSLTVDHDRIVLENGDDQEAIHCPPALSEGSHHPDRFSGVADDFIAAIRSKGRTGNIDEALFCARAIALAQQSSASGGAVLTV